MSEEEIAQLYTMLDTHIEDVRLALTIIDAQSDDSPVFTNRLTQILRTIYKKNLRMIDFKDADIIDLVLKVRERCQNLR